MMEQENHYNKIINELGINVANSAIEVASLKAVNAGLNETIQNLQAQLSEAEHNQKEGE